LLPDDQRERLEVVLVSPRNPLNIGAVARAMANFGLRRLSVVAPFAPHWREARSAVGAPALLENAKETASLAEAVAGCTVVVGTGTLTYRKAEQVVVPLPELSPLVERELGGGGRVALVFGPEKHGLSREDLSFCHWMVEIPTDPGQPSMNLGQAVAVCLYELSSRGGLAGSAGPVEAPQRDGPGPDRAESGRLDLLAGVVEQTMEAAGYSPNVMQAANRHDLRLLLRRLSLSERDMRRILGLFRRILWRLRRAPAGGREGH
jgi:tRNA/rRNA methyltransferase